MTVPISQRPGRRLLVVMPSWVGDIVMATPTLRALRAVEPSDVITVLVRRSMRQLLEHCPWIDRIVSFRQKSTFDRRSGLVSLAARLRRGHFDAAVLLSNSFRSALLARMAKVPHRVGYDRDGRGFLLTDRLVPRRDDGRFVPVPTLDYYLALARYEGAQLPETRMQLFTADEDDREADRLLANGGLCPGRALVLLTPGANFGDAKMWPPPRFAAVADLCHDRLDCVVAVAGSPSERPVLDAVLSAARAPILDLESKGVGLRLLKSVVKRSSLVITNDTGPRHMAAAFGTPVLTIFGPTDPAWTEIQFDREQQMAVKVFCGPCQKKRCPLDHRCMTRIEPQAVFNGAARLLGAAASVEAAGPAVVSPP
jgi:heptosyltransferase-2